MLKMISMLYWAKFLPEEVLLSTSNYSEFASKVEKLLELEEDQYRDLISKSSSYYMMQDIDNPPHKIILNRISKFLAVG